MRAWAYMCVHEPASVVVACADMTPCVCVCMCVGVRRPAAHPDVGWVQATLRRDQQPQQQLQHGAVQRLVVEPQLACHKAAVAAGLITHVALVPHCVHTHVGTR